MRDGWVDTVLGELAEITTGSRAKGGAITSGIPSIGGEQIAEDRSIKFNKMKFIPKDHFESMRTGKLKFGDSLLVKDGATTGKVGYWGYEIPAAVNEHVFILRAKPDCAEPYFINLLISHKPFREEIESRTRGIIGGITRDIENIELVVPPLSEQKRIADLIASVDSYIEALQQQLESAKRSRNAVLHELLTTGADDWVETTLGEVALLNPSEPALSDTAHFAPMDAVHVGKRWLQYTEERRDRNGARARAGDVLFARITPCLENGKIAQVQSEFERCGGSTEFIVVRGTEKCTSDFLYFWCTLKVNRDKAAELMTGTTGRQRLSWQDLGSLSLWLPPITEQNRIVSNISEFDSLIESTESAITESQNLRTGLLSDLLSGDHEIPASYDVVIGAA